MYSSERNVQILLALFKAHGIKKMVLSPGSANASFVASAQYDSEFELYSSVDERSAAYIACGLAEECGEPVVICCTGATASRNYMPGLTEAYYRKLPIVAVTATRPISWVGQNRDQLIDRSIVPNDIAVKSVHLPIVQNDDDAWECNLKINDALLELNRNGGGPVHINLTTAYSIDFSVKTLPQERVIQRYFADSKLPTVPVGNIIIFVGTHSKWKETLKRSVEKFCKCYNAVVLYDQTSNYSGEYGIPCGMFDLTGFPNIKTRLIIHIGNISASWPMDAEEVWRINPDGEIRDTFRKLTKVFEMQEENFFEKICTEQKENNTQYKYWISEYNNMEKGLKSRQESLKLSSLWIALTLYKRIPKNAILHFGILNSLRCWNCFKLDQTIRGYSNTGGFGIDGGISSLIGASLVNKNKIYYGFFGDLAFFYDMNSLGNRHVGVNVRILVANNGLGGEFKNSFGNVQRAGFGDSANDYISAYGHYGNQSRELLMHYAEDLGFEYLAVETKEDFLMIAEKFTSSQKQVRPMLVEVFMDDHDDVEALDVLSKLGHDDGYMNDMVRKTKKLAKNILGDNGVKLIKKIVH